MCFEVNSSAAVAQCRMWPWSPHPARASPAWHAPSNAVPAAGCCREAHAQREGRLQKASKHKAGGKDEQKLKACFSLQGKLLEKSKHFKCSDSSDKNNLDNKRLPVCSSSPELGSLNRSI